MAFRLIHGDGRLPTVRATHSAMANSSASSTSIPQPRGRRRERRQRFSVFLAALASGRIGASAPAGHRDSVDVALRALVPIRSARLTTQPVGAAVVEPEGDAPEVLRFPVSTPTRPELHLEVSLDPSCGLDGWDRQSLGDAARVFGLMLGSRGGPVSGHPGRPPDGAAPMIGSSACMQQLRMQIERVAATDFTVLIEGECGP